MNKLLLIALCLGAAAAGYCTLSGDPHITTTFGGGKRVKYNHYKLGRFTAFQQGNLRVQLQQGTSKRWKRRAIIHAIYVTHGKRKYSLKINRKNCRVKRSRNFRRNYLKFGSTTISVQKRCMHGSGNHHINIKIRSKHNRGIRGTCVPNKRRRARRLNYGHVRSVAKKCAGKDYKQTLALAAKRCGNRCRSYSTTKKCAREHAKDDRCFCRGTVSYGARGRWKRRRSSRYLRCRNSVFGDPIRGVVKNCFCKQRRTTCKSAKKHYGCQLDRIRSLCARRKAHLSKAAVAKQRAKTHHHQFKKHISYAKRAGEAAKRNFRNARKSNARAKNFNARAKDQHKLKGEANARKHAANKRRARNLKIAAHHSRAAAAAYRKLSRENAKKAYQHKIARGHFNNARRHAKRSAHHARAARKASRKARLSRTHRKKHLKLAQYHGKQAKLAFKRYRVSTRAGHKAAAIARAFSTFNKYCAEWKKLAKSYSQLARKHFKWAVRHMGHLKRSKLYKKWERRNAAKAAKRAAFWSRVAVGNSKKARSHHAISRLHRHHAKRRLKYARHHARAAAAARRAAIAATSKKNNANRRASADRRDAVVHKRRASRHARSAKLYRRIAKSHSRLAALAKRSGRRNNARKNALNQKAKKSKSDGDRQRRVQKAHEAAARKLGF